MNAADLYKLARVLQDVALRATANPNERPVSAGLLAIVDDVGRHPGSAVGDIAERTGLAQSFVSKTVAKLRDRGVVTITPDPRDGRRTLVTVDPGIRQREFAPRGERPIDTALTEVVNGLTVRQVARIKESLDVLAQELIGGRDA